MKKEILVFDDLIDFDERLRSYEFMRKSYFKIGWGDSTTEEHVKYAYLNSRYSKEDCNNLGLYKKIMDSEVGEIVKNLTMSKAIVNLSTPSDVNFVHSHPEKKVILYYANINWEEGWYGETLFFDDFRKNIQFVSPYIPGRIIVFDGNIPHTIRPQSILASNYRFTFSIFFE